MDDVSYIIGLMRENYEAVSLIPGTTLRERYIPNQQYIIQRDRRGIPVGYLLYGSLKPGQLLHVSQTVISQDRRQQGHGMTELQELIRRAKLINARAIQARIASDLIEARQLFETNGFIHTNERFVTNTRKRTIGYYVLDLWPTLWTY